MAQEIGPEVATPPALAPHTITDPLSGQYVDLVPLTPTHTAPLFSILAGPEHDHLWTYVTSGPFASQAEFAAFITTAAQSTNPFHYTITPHSTGQPTGYLALMDIQPLNRSVEVGRVMFAPSLQQTREATEVFYLLFRHVFERLGFRRLTWETNSFNLASRRAALRLGLRFEGVLRCHQVVKGRSRDTALYSMLGREWEGVKPGFIGWLDEANFDEEQRQRRKLEDVRTGAGI